MSNLRTFQSGPKRIGVALRFGYTCGGGSNRSPRMRSTSHDQSGTGSAARKRSRRQPGSAGQLRDQGAPASYLAEALRECWRVYLERLHKCQRKPSEKSVHQLRIAIRRLSSQLVLLGELLPKCACKKTRQILKDQLQLLSPLRDVHVQRKAITRQTTRFPELLILQRRLEERERHLVKCVARQIQRFKTRKVLTWVSDTLIALNAKASTLRGQNALTSAAVRCAGRLFDKVVQRRRRIDPSDSLTIHRTRVAFKRFRYVVDALPAQLTGLDQRGHRALAGYQRRMGSIQDLELIQALIVGFGEEQEGNQIVLGPFATYVRGRRTRAIRQFLKSANALSGFWPPLTSSAN